jgi:hypothetical protein
MAKFLTELDAKLLNDDTIWELDGNLKYHSDILDCDADVPKGFQMDFASIPRIPVVFEILGDTAHREGALHDYFYCKNSIPVVTRAMADNILLEAMKSRNKPWYKNYAIYWGVRIGGWAFFHKRNVEDKLCTV